MQDSGRQDHMDDPANRMIDRDLHFARMPASTDGQDESPPNFGGQHVHESATVLIAHAEQFGRCRIEAGDSTPDVDRYHRRVERLQESIGVFEHLNALPVQESVFQRD